MSISLHSFRDSRREVMHPLHVAVVEIGYNSQDKFATLQCKAFNDDLELGLQKRYGKAEDIADTRNMKDINAEMDGYIKSHLQIKINDKPVSFSFINYKEGDNNAVDVCFRINNVNDIQKIEISNTIFYELYDDQLQIIYITVNGNRKSNKVRNPDSKLTFDF